MKKVLLAMAVCVSMFAAGCAGVIWNTSFHETATHGSATKMVEGAGAKEVGSYTSILGIWNLGYDTYAGLVSSELRKGKRNYHQVVKNYFLWQQTTGYVEVLE